MEKEELKKILKEKKGVPEDITLGIKEALEPLKERAEKKKKF